MPVPSSSSHRLSIVRSPAGLTTVHSHRRGAFKPPDDRDAPPLASLFEVEKTALVGPRLPAALAEVAAAWDRLAIRGAHGPEVLSDILLVLLSTVPAADNEAIPAVRLEEPPAAPRATAAHPRAYRGTKARPPKADAPVRGDLRPLLCSRASTRLLLEALWSSRTSALHRLGRQGVDRSGLARLGACGSPPADPSLVLHHTGVPARPALSPAFVEHLLGSLRGAPWDLVRKAAAAHERLGLAHDEPLSYLVARLLQTSRPGALGWLQALETQPRERRLAFLVLVLESAVAEREGYLDGAVCNELAHAPAEVYERWVYVALDGHRRGINPLYLATGLRWAARYAPDARVPSVPDAPGFREGTARRLEALLREGWTGWGALGLWETCGVVPGFCAYVDGADWGSFTSPQKEYLLRFFMDMRWHQEGTCAPERWRAIAACLPRIERRVREIPADYTDQYLNDLGTELGHLRGPVEIRDRLPLLIDLLARVSRSPFAANGNAALSLGHLLTLPTPIRRRVLDASDGAFLALDKACRRSNAATLVGWGLSSLVSGLPDLVGEAFGSATAPLARTARHLGTLSWPARARIVSRCAGSPIFDGGLGARSLFEIVATIDAAGVPEASAVVPRAVREHAAGRRQLTPGQVGRHREHVKAALPACRLAVVRSAVDAQLASAVGSTHVEREVLSALAVLQQAWKNRRGLRRLLRAYLNGNGDHVLRHPATREWVRRHPRIDLGLWTRGLERRVPAPDGREIVIRLEQDPLEVLKMGTYVGTCLGLGGGHTYSAAAVALDVNKQVLYARDGQGSVVARQLVAISSADELVPFLVYPESAPGWLRLAFDQYDSELAAALGIPRVAPREPYDVEYVLCHLWWDDGACEPDRG